jgi:hypothetical protein
MKMVNYIFPVLCFALLLLQTTAHCQQKDSLFVKHKDTPVKKSDSLVQKAKPADTLHKQNSTVKKKHDPGKASLYSAILPGLGQIYNKKYWKLPLVYAAVGIPVYTYSYNRSWYKKCQYALAVIVNNTTGDHPSGLDSINRVDPKLQSFVTYQNATSLKNYRDEFRRDQDYSVLFLLLFWGLQIVDATVDAHLKDFNVNSDLSFHIQPAYFPGTMAAGLSLIFDIHKSKTKLIDLR